MPVTVLNTQQVLTHLIPLKASAGAAITIPMFANAQTEAQKDYVTFPGMS